MGKKPLEWGVRLLLARELYMAFIKFQGKRELSRSKAGLLLFTEGLYKLGCISKEVYETYVKRYSVTLLETEPRTLEELNKRTKLKERERAFSNIIKDPSSLKIPHLNNPGNITLFYKVITLCGNMSMRKQIRKLV